MTRTLHRALAVAVAVALTGCGSLGLSRGADPTAVREADVAIAETVADARQAAEARPGDAAAVIRYADALGLAYERGTVARERLAGAAMVPDALARLDAVLAADPHDAVAADLLAARGWLQRRTDAPGAGLDDLEASMQRYPNLRALDGLAGPLGDAGELDALSQHCSGTYELAVDDAARFEVLEICRAARHDDSRQQALAWAGPTGVALYERTLAERQAAATQSVWTVQTTSTRTENGVTTTSHSSSGSGYGGTVHLGSDCPRDVPLYIGELDGPLTTDGAHGTHGQGARHRYWLGPDDHLCIVTHQREILACVKPQDGTRLRIAASCTGFASD